MFALRARPEASRNRTATACVHLPLLGYHGSLGIWVVWLSSCERPKIPLADSQDAAGHHPRLAMNRRLRYDHSVLHAPLAQLAEQRTLNPRVRGSSPWRRTRTDLGLYRSRLFFMCPFCPHVRSAFARESRPGSRRACQNCRGGVASDDGQPLRALDQWSIPLPSTSSIGLLVQLRSVKRASSSLLPERTGQGIRLGRESRAYADNGIGRRSEPGTAGPLRMHHRVRWAPPRLRPARGECLLRCQRRGRHTAGHRRFTRVGRTRADGTERPAAPAWPGLPGAGRHGAGWTAFAFPGTIWTPRISSGHQAVTGHTVHR
jgi:hypothetical protein